MAVSPNVIAIVAVLVLGGGGLAAFYFLYLRPKRTKTIVKQSMDQLKQGQEPVKLDTKSSSASFHSDVVEYCSATQVCSSADDDSDECRECIESWCGSKDNESGGFLC